MLKITFYSLLCLLIPFAIPAQSFNIEWQGCFGGSAWDSANDIIKIDDGYLIVGSTGSDDGDISFNHGAGDIWLLKINNTGDLLWEKTFGGSSGEHVGRILPTNDGNYYIIGVSGSSDGDVSKDPYPDSGDLWLLKIDAEGNIIWEEIYGGIGWEQLPTGVATNDGGLVVLVNSSSNDGDISMHYGLWDAWMIKVNSEGEKEWDFTLGSPGQDFGNAITQTSDGGFLVGISTELFEGGNITCTSHSYNSDAVLVKLDANLNIEWDRCYGGSNHDGVTALAEISDGYIMGGYAGSNDGDITGWHGKTDIWILKVDFDGNILWQKCLGGTKSEFINNISNNENAGYIISAFTKSSNGDVSGNHSNSEHSSDIWIVNLDNDGELLWQHCFGGIGSEELQFGFHYKSDYNFVIAGRTNHGPSFDVQCTPHGGSLDIDFWVFEISDTTVNINEQVVPEAKIKTYPNPAKNYVCFEAVAGQQIQSSQLTICNGQGAILKKPILYASAGKLIWDTRTIQPGIYFYTLTLNSFTKSGKLIIK